MGDVNDANISSAERGDNAEHFLSFGIRKRRSGFVEYQQAGSLLNSAADFHHLLAGGAEFIHAPSGLQGKMMFFDDALGAFHHAASIYPAQRQARFAAQKYIFS